MTEEDTGKAKRILILIYVSCLIGVYWGLALTSTPSLVINILKALVSGCSLMLMGGLTGILLETLTWSYHPQESKVQSSSKKEPED